MPRTRSSSRNPMERIAALADDLADIMGRTHSQQELSILLEGLLTPTEIEGITLRWQLLKFLADGMPQRRIQERLGICLGKISRGSRLLKYGNPDFVELIARIRNERMLQGKNNEPTEET